jgi:hypothetical protein
VVRATPGYRLSRSRCHSGKTSSVTSGVPVGSPRRTLQDAQLVQRRLPATDPQREKRPGQRSGMVADVVQLALAQAAVGADGEVAGTDAAERHGQMRELGAVALARAHVVGPAHRWGSMG